MSISSQIALNPSLQGHAALSSQTKHIRVTVRFTQVIRTTVEVFTQQVTYITQSGVVDSVRQPPDGYFKIGRQQVTENGQRPNDLMLPPSDRAISRSHCMIDYQAFFDCTPPEAWYAFLMGSHPRLGNNSILINIPLEILRYILSFIKQQRYPLLIDLGSMCGTFIKVSNSEPIELEQSMNFLVGSDINIEFDRVVNNFSPVSDTDDLLEERNNTMHFDAHMFQAPYVIIKVSKTGGDNEATVQTSTWKFVAEEHKSRFSIGRSQNCDINLPENTISRTQCRVVYEKNKWLLLDGVEGKPTVNGTWQSICKRNNLIRNNSTPCPLKNGSQIKISDTIVQVDWNQ
jgi:hypothetical protein